MVEKKIPEAGSDRMELEIEIKMQLDYWKPTPQTREGLLELCEKFVDAHARKLCLQMAEILSKALSQRERLDVLTRIGRLEGIGVDQMEAIAKVLANVNIEGLISPVKMCDTWKGVVETVNSYLEKAEETIYFATKYFDYRTIESIIMAIQRGVKFRSLIDKSLSTGIKSRVKLLGSMISHPRMFKLFYDFVGSAEEISRYVDLPYTFIVIDGRYAMIEITNPLTNAFYVAFFFHNGEICKRLIENFKMLWEKGTIPHISHIQTLSMCFAIHIPVMDMVISNVECLNPAETLPETIFPVTNPSVNECSISGVIRVLVSSLVWINVPPMVLMLLNS